MGTETGRAVPGKVQRDLPEAGKYSFVKEGKLPSSYHDPHGGIAYRPINSEADGIGIVHLTSEQAERLGHHTGIGYKLKLSVNGEAGRPGQIFGTLRKVKTQDGYSYMPDGDKTISWLKLDDAPDIVNYELEVWAL